MTFFPPADDFSQLLYFIVQQINKTMQKVGSTSVGGGGVLRGRGEGCGRGRGVTGGGGGYVTNRIFQQLEHSNDRWKIREGRRAGGRCYCTVEQRNHATVQFSLGVGRWGS